MQGSVFLDFIRLANEQCGVGLVDHVLEQPGLASSGSYLANRSYEDRELIALALALGFESEVTPNQLLRNLGAQVFIRYASDYAGTLDAIGSTAGLLGAIDHHVANSGAILGPYADLLQVHGLHLDSGQLLLQSLMRPPLLDVATGFFAAATSYFAEDLTVVSTLEPDDGKIAADGEMQAS